MIPTDAPNPRLLNQLARIVGLFGARGWPSVNVVQDDNTERFYPVTEDAAKNVQYARQILAEYGKGPVTE
jgi:hypothetical protein